MTLFLNGYPVEFSEARFTACVGELPDPKQLKELRNELGTEWFTHWRSGKVYAIPNVAQPAIQYGMLTTLECGDHDNLHVLTARITARLPSCFPQYEAFSRRPFAFLGRKDEFVSKITEKWKNVPPLLQHFEIRPRFELDPRIIELRDGETTIALFLAVSTRWNCFAPLQDLDKAGIDLAGLHVIRREPVPGQRRLVGRIQSVDGEVVTFSEAYDDSKTIPTADVWLEGSRASFKRCLSKLLGSRFKEFEGFRDAEQGGLLTGPGLSELLNRMQQVLAKASPIHLSDDLSCTISDRLRLENRDGYQTVIPLTLAEYCYDPARSKRGRYAWAGLERFGPYDRESFAKRTPRVLVVCPDRAIGQVGQALKSFRDGISTVRNSAYEKGFARTFHLMNPEFVTVQVPLLQDRHDSPHQAYRKALEDHLARDSSYDVAITIILDDHSRLPDDANPYLYSKAILLTNGIPVQEAKLTTMTSQAFSLQYIFQNMAVAMYAKMGGLPWTVDHGLTVDDEIVIGMGTAELSGSRFEQRQRHIGITTVFRGDGNYLLSNLTRECSYDQYPAVLRDSTVDVLKEIRTRNAWRKGDTIRVVFHAFKPLKDVEVATLSDPVWKRWGRSRISNSPFSPFRSTIRSRCLTLHRREFDRENATLR